MIKGLKHIRGIGVCAPSSLLPPPQPRVIPCLDTDPGSLSWEYALSLETQAGGYN